MIDNLQRSETIVLSQRERPIVLPDGLDQEDIRFAEASSYPSIASLWLVPEFYRIPLPTVTNTTLLSSASHVHVLEMIYANSSPKSSRRERWDC